MPHSIENPDLQASLTKKYSEAAVGARLPEDANRAQAGILGQRISAETSIGPAPGRFRTSGQPERAHPLDIPNPTQDRLFAAQMDRRRQLQASDQRAFMRSLPQGDPAEAQRRLNEGPSPEQSRQQELRSRANMAEFILKADRAGGGEMSPQDALKEAGRLRGLDPGERTKALRQYRSQRREAVGGAKKARRDALIKDREDRKQFQQDYRKARREGKERPVYKGGDIPSGRTAAPTSDDLAVIRGTVPKSAVASAAGGGQARPGSQEGSGATGMMGGVGNAVANPPPPAQTYDQRVTEAMPKSKAGSKVGLQKISSYSGKSADAVRTQLESTGSSVGDDGIVTAPNEAAVDRLVNSGVLKVGDTVIVNGKRFRVDPD